MLQCLIFSKPYCTVYICHYTLENDWFPKVLEFSCIFLKYPAIGKKVIIHHSWNQAVPTLLEVPKANRNIFHL